MSARCAPRTPRESKRCLGVRRSSPTDPLSAHRSSTASCQRVRLGPKLRGHALANPADAGVTSGPQVRRTRIRTTASACRGHVAIGNESIDAKEKLSTGPSGKSRPGSRARPSSKRPKDLDLRLAGSRENRADDSTTQIEAKLFEIRQVIG